jgi:tetratricopeptide (TPR) repeat protein
MRGGKMKFTIQKFSSAFLIVFLFVTNVQAQEVPSTGRSNSVTLDFNNNNYKALKRMREFIDEGKFQRAADRASRFIKSNNNNLRNGSSMTPATLEAYNILCVANTSLGQVKDGMEACNESIKNTPNSWESLKSRATLYYMTQDFKSSLSDFESALANSPNDAISDVLKQNIGVVKSKVQ